MTDAARIAHKPYCAIYDPGDGVCSCWSERQRDMIAALAAEVERLDRAALIHDLVTRLLTENRHVEPTVADILTLIEPLVGAVEERLKAGHNDTCGYALTDDHRYPCTCGHEALRAALAQERPESAPPHEESA